MEFNFRKQHICCIFFLFSVLSAVLSVALFGYKKDGFLNSISKTDVSSDFDYSFDLCTASFALNAISAGILLLCGGDNDVETYKPVKGSLGYGALNSSGAFNQSIGSGSDTASGAYNRSIETETASFRYKDLVGKEEETDKIDQFV